MNATLNIVVRVAAKQAQAQLAATAAAAKAIGAGGALGANAKGLSANASGMGAYLGKLREAVKAQQSFSSLLANNALSKAGKNMTWVGRQLAFNFTLPLVLAGKALFSFNMDLERSMTQVRKVYGNLGEDQNVLKAETEALSKSFELLSTRFGVLQTDVIDIGAAWASAGSSGRGLAENTRATLELMILGEMDAASATEALIAIQAQWRLSTYDAAGGVSELHKAMSIMNIVENETGITMAGLVEVFQRASGSARSAGVTIDELAGFAAALVPATGSAAQAGNALKTIFSRLQDPTQETVDVLKEIGFTVSDPSWLGATATQKIKMLAGQWDNLSTAQRGIASSTIASRWQVSRFDVLMDDVSSSTGYFAKAMEAANGPVDDAEQYQKELMQVLDSNPKKWDIMTNSIKNSMASAFIPLIPVIMNIVNFIRQLADAFAKLSPKTRGIILYGLALVAIVGPILIVIGSLLNLMAVIDVFSTLVWRRAKTLARAFRYIGIQFYKLVVQPILTGLWTIVGAIAGTLGIPVWAVLAIIVAVAAAIALVLTTDIEDPFIRVFQSIVDAIAELPSIMAEVFTNVIHVLGRAMEVVVDLLSYLNPFARHSPSLVDNVRAGVSTILDEYDRLKSIPATVARAMASLGAFRAVASNDITGFRRTKTDADVAKITAMNPAAGNAAAVMADSIDELYAALEPLTVEIEAQSRIVDDLSRAYDAATQRMDEANDVVDAITDELDAVGERLDAAKSKLNDFASAPIAGMRDMEDQIFANSQAQNVLNLRLLEFERAGTSIEKIQEKWAALNADIEMLRGKREDLRLAGAGSDVLGAYDEQIKALEDQKGGLQDSQNEIQAIQDQLDELDLEGRFLDLTKSITFDPLVREIDQMVNGVEELTFDEIIAGITEQQKIVNELQPQYDGLVQKQKEAQAVAKEAAAAQELVGDQLDIEQTKLDQLEDAYRDIKDLISEMESEMADYISMAETAANIEKTKKGDEESLFAAGEGVDFDVAGGDSTLGREGDLFDIEAFNKELETEIDEAMKKMGDFDIFAAFGDSIDKLKGWKDKAIEVFKSIPDWMKQHWPQLLIGALAAVLILVFGPFGPLIAAALGAAIAYVAGPVAKWTYDHILKPMYDVLLGIGQWLMDNLVQPVADFFASLGGSTVDFSTSIWDFFTDLGSAIWGFFRGVVGAVIGFFRGVGGVLSTIWNSVIMPVFGAIASVVGGLVDVFATVWGAISGAIMAAWNIIYPIFQTLWGYIDGYIIPILQLIFVTVEIVFTLIWKIIQAAWWIIQEYFDLWVDYLHLLIDVFGLVWDHIDDVAGWISTAIGIMVDFITDVFDILDWIIRNVVVKAFDWFRDRVVDVADIVWKAIQGMWAVMEEIFTAIDYIIDTLVVPAFRWFGDQVRWVVDNLITPAMNWLRDNVMQPVMNAITSIVQIGYDAIRGIFAGFQEILTPVQAALRWLYNSVIKPIMEAIGSLISGVWNGILDTIAGGINGFIGAFNLVADAVNAVASLLGIGHKVSHMDPVSLNALKWNFDTGESDAAVNGGGGGSGGAVPRFAKGGVVGEEGGAVAGMRALVGEGSNIFPEFVIPTDPKYRQRARGLYSELGHVFGEDEQGYSNMDLFGIGDIVKNGFNAAKSGIGKVTGFLKDKAIETLWNPAHWLAQQAVNRIPNKFLKDSGQGVLNAVNDWITGADNAWNEEASKRLPPQVEAGAGSWRAIPPVLQALGIPYKILSTYRPGAITRNTGQPSWHGKDRAIDLSGPSGMINYSPHDLLDINHAIYRAFKPQLKELIYGGPGATNVFRGADHSFSPALMREHINHVHAALARGGLVVPRTNGGTLLRVGEGLHDEAIQVTPLHGKSESGENVTLNFYGDLSFPNITDPHDADRFITNLKSLGQVR